MTDTTDTATVPPLRAVPMPSRIRALPRTQAGYPIPFFAARLDDGTRDLRIMSDAALTACVLDQRCWICGQRRRRGEHAFVLGPMCTITLVTAEPPSHVDCAEYAVQVCPFMVRPDMTRRTRGLEGAPYGAGHGITRNPGVVAIWAAKTWSTFRPDRGQDGTLFNVGAPLTRSWWAHGRPATRTEVLAAIDSGLPLLHAEADAHPTTRTRADARRQLNAQHAAALRFLPTEEKR